MPRHPDHDYKSPCIYHITLRKLPGVPDFSIPVGSPEQARCHLYPLGDAVERCVRTISDINPSIKMLQYIIMPDHVHLLIQVKEYLDEHLGVYIGKFKVKCIRTAEWRGIFQGPLFESQYHDRFLRPYHSLNVIYQYIRHNPHRYIARKSHPDYFRRINNLFSYEGYHWQAYGNMQLLLNPFKDYVICHRVDANTPGLEEKKRKIWLHTASNGGVLVSPFISRKEKDVRREAEDQEGKIILLVNEPFTKIYKPWGHDFELCAQGRLLIIAPTVEIPGGSWTWHFLNKLSQQICLWRW